MAPHVRIMLVLRGCANRPFYHIAASYVKRRPDQPVIEQIGAYDPMPNENNENLVSINLDRLGHWLGRGATPTSGVGQLLGLAGYTLPHPLSIRTAWRNRQKAAAAPTKPPSDGSSNEDEGKDAVSGEMEKQKASASS